MRDRGVGEHPLEVGLGEPQDGADDHGDDRDPVDQRPPGPLGGAEGDVEQPQDRPERGDLRAGGHEGGDRRRRPLVDVRRPGVERRDAGLEQQADDEQREAEHQQDVGALGDVGLADVAQADAAGGPVDQRQAVEEEGRGEGAEEEVLDRRLLREQAAPAGQPADQVQRQAEHLERDEHDQQVVGSRRTASCRRWRRSPAGRPRSAPARRWRARGPGGCPPAPPPTSRTPTAPGRARARRTAAGPARRGRRSSPAGTAPAPSTASAPAAVISSSRAGQQQACRPARRGCRRAPRRPARGAGSPAARTPRSARPRRPRRRRTAAAPARRGRGQGPRSSVGPSEVAHGGRDGRFDQVQQRLGVEARARGSARPAARPPPAHAGRGRAPGGCARGAVSVAVEPPCPATGSSSSDDRSTPRAGPCMVRWYISRM